MTPAPLHFAVRYRPGEYVAFAIAHALDTDGFVRAAPRWKQALFAVALANVAAATFVWKSWRVGRCRFVVDADGIARASRRGVSEVPWSRVMAVHVYRPGYLIELEAGAVPVPFRVLAPDARARFEAFAGTRLHGGSLDR